MFSDNEILTQGRMGNASVEGRISQFLSDQINLGSNNFTFTLCIQFWYTNMYRFSGFNKLLLANRYCVNSKTKEGPYISEGSLFIGLFHLFYICGACYLLQLRNTVYLIFFKYTPLVATINLMVSRIGKKNQTVATRGIKKKENDPNNPYFSSVKRVAPALKTCYCMSKK